MPKLQRRLLQLGAKAMKDFLSVLAGMVVLIYAGFVFGVYHTSNSVEADCKEFGAAKLSEGVIIECKVEY